MNISAFERDALRFEGKEPEEYCQPVTRLAYLVETAVANMYAHFAQTSRKSETIDEVISIWGSMIQVCESASKVIVALREKFPTCITEDFYDRILEYWSAAKDRFDRASEEKEWQSKLPPALFPIES